MNSETFQAPTLEELSPLFPNYSIDAFIAQGGMGAVYLGTQLSLERPVAIKILPRHLGADEEFRASFSTEAKSMAKLNHPNLIGVYDFGEVDGMPFIVMEYVAGKSLHDSSYGKQIDSSEAGRIVAAICRGLHHAHEQGILHRDVKPANILLAQDAKPKLGDFGLAMASTGESDGLIYGTPGYAAPEVYAGNPDQRSDVYAAAVMLYQLLTGEMPGDPYRHPSQLVSCDKRLDRLLSKALQPEPSDRHEDAEEFATELEKITNTPVARAVPVTPASVSPARVTALPSSKKNGSPIVIAAVVTIAAIGGMALVALSSKDEVQPGDATEDMAETTEEERASKAAETRENNRAADEAKNAQRREAEEQQEKERLAQRARRKAEREERMKEEAAAAKAAEEEAMASEETPEEEDKEPEVAAVSTFDHDGFLKRGRDYCRQNADRDITAYEKALVKNIESLLREGKSILRDEEDIDRDTERARRDNMERAIAQFITSGRLPKGLAVEPPEAFSDLTDRDGVVSAAIEEALDEQDKLDDEIEASLQPLLISYLSGVRKQVAALAAKGNKIDADILEREATATESSFPRFLAILQGEDLPPPLTEDLAEEQLSDFGDELAEFSIVGNWKRENGRKNISYTITEDKTILMDDGKANGTWEKSDNGNYHVKWGNGIELILTPLGEDTVSVNGGLFTLRRTS